MEEGGAQLKIRIDKKLLEKQIEMCDEKSDDINLPMEEREMFVGIANLLDAILFTTENEIESKPTTCKIIEWIDDGHVKRECSNCEGDITKVTSWMEIDYCPLCGAKVKRRKKK